MLAAVSSDQKVKVVLVMFWARGTRFCLGVQRGVCKARQGGLRGKTRCEAGPGRGIGLVGSVQVLSD